MPGPHQPHSDERAARHGERELAMEAPALSPQVRVLVVDDEEDFRNLVETKLSGSEQIRVVASVPDGRAAVDRVAAGDDVDVVVMDLNMPGLTGFDAAERIRRRAPHVRVLVMTALDGVDARIRATAAGADGVLLKATGQGPLIESILAVHAGVKVYSDPPLASPPEREFTPREWEVFAELCVGRRNRRIARDLGMAESTVKTHVTAVMRKLDVQSRSEVSARAVELGLIVPSRGQS